MATKARGLVLVLAMAPAVLVAMAATAPAASAAVGTVTARNLGPLAVAENTARSWPLGTLQVGATDTDPNPAAVCCKAALATTPSYGMVAVNADGSFTYTPDKAFAGKDSFTFTLTDSDGNVSAPATVILNVLYRCDSNPWPVVGRPPVHPGSSQGFYIAQSSRGFSLFTAHPGGPRWCSRARSR